MIMIIIVVRIVVVIIVVIVIIVVKEQFDKERGDHRPGKRGTARGEYAQKVTFKSLRKGPKGNL